MEGLNKSSTIVCSDTDEIWFGWDVDCLKRTYPVQMCSWPWCGAVAVPVPCELPSERPQNCSRRPRQYHTPSAPDCSAFWYLHYTYTRTRFLSIHAFVILSSLMFVKLTPGVSQRSSDLRFPELPPHAAPCYSTCGHRRWSEVFILLRLLLDIS